MSVSSGGGAWSTDYGRPWSAAADLCRHRHSDAAVALGMGNTLSYFTSGGGAAATTATETGGGAAVAAAPSAAPTTRRYSLGRRSSAADSRAKKQPQPPAAADGDDNEEFHDSASYFTDVPRSAAATTSLAVNGKVVTALGRSPGETRRDVNGSAHLAAADDTGANGDRGPLSKASAPVAVAAVSAPSPQLSATASDIRTSHFNNRDEGGVSLKARPTYVVAAQATAASTTAICDERTSASAPAASASVPPKPAPRASVLRQPPPIPPPLPPPQELPQLSREPCQPPIVKPGGGSRAANAAAGRSSSGVDVTTAISDVAQRPSSARTARAPTSLLAGVDMDLANIISTVEQLSQKANSPVGSSAAVARPTSAAPVATSGGSTVRSGTGGVGGHSTPSPLTPATPPSLQLSPRDSQPPATASSEQLAAELRSAIEARVKRSVSLKDQHSLPPASAAAGHRHRRTSSLTHLDDSAAGQQQSAAEAQQQRTSQETVADTETRSRDRRARLQNMERRREQQLSEVRGGCFSMAPGADIAPVAEDASADSQSL